MSDPHQALQDAIVAALKADLTLNAIVDDRIYDEPPKRPQFPYVTVGDGQTLSDKADCIDGSEIFFRLDAWSQPVAAGGYLEVKAIVGAVSGVLDDAELALVGHRLIDLQRHDVQYLRESDDLTRHAAMTFRALTESII